MFEDADVAFFWSRVDRSGGPSACWPFLGCRIKRRGGYGQIRIDGKLWYAHRVAFVIEHGRPPKKLACHRCNNPPCCNPRHLFDGTHKENAEQAAREGRIGKWDRRGSVNPSAKLTETDVRRIRSLLGTMPRRQIAKQFGVTPTAIYWIAKGHNWSHLDDSNT